VAGDLGLVVGHGLAHGERQVICFLQPRLAAALSRLLVLSVSLGSPGRLLGLLLTQKVHVLFEHGGLQSHGQRVPQLFGPAHLALTQVLLQQGEGGARAVGDRAGRGALEVRDQRG